MAKQKKSTEPQIILKREYIVPLRKEWLKVPEYKRASKAIKALKKFIARHMKLYNSDLRNVKIDILLNNEIRFRGMKKPPAKIKVLAKKLDNNIIKVELVNLPAHVKFVQLREQKKSAEIKKKVEEKQKTKPETKETESEDSEPNKNSDSKESEKSQKETKEESLKISKSQAKEIKHTSKDKKVVQHRKALSR